MSPNSLLPFNFHLLNPFLPTSESVKALSSLGSTENQIQILLHIYPDLYSIPDTPLYIAGKKVMGCMSFLRLL